MIIKNVKRSVAMAARWFDKHYPRWWSEVDLELFPNGVTLRSTPSGFHANSA